MEPDAVSKTNNALLKAVLKIHLWKHQLEEGKLSSVREMSAIVNISMKCIQQIVRLNYLSHKTVKDIVNRRQTGSLMLADLKEVPMLWSEQLEKFYRLAVPMKHIYYNRSYQSEKMSRKHQQTGKAIAKK
jgi:hypothetical protein